MPLIKFTRNHEDLSTDRGYQFKFLCDKCGNGHLTTFVPSMVGLAGTALRAMGSFFGGILGRASYSAQDLQRLAQGKGHDEAFEKAIAEAKGFFKQCSRCGNWVCPETCWNAKRGLCEACAPDLEEQIASAQAEAQVQQVREKLSREDLLKGVDVTSEATVRCPSCDAKVMAGKFCPECGAALHPASTCAKCGARFQPGAKFCPECGAKAAPA
jgi:double zinc ribbon protein